MSNKALLPVIAAAALAVSAPAMAQSHGGWHNDGGIGQRQAQLEQRVQRMAANGIINRGEYRNFQRQFEHVSRLERDYRRDGLNRWERRELNAQLDRIQNQIRYERADNRRDDRRDRRDRRNDRGW